MNKFEKLIISIVDSLDSPFTLDHVRRIVIITTGNPDTISLDQRIRTNLNKMPNITKKMLKFAGGECSVYTKSPPLESE